MAEERGYPIHVSVFLKGIMQDVDINDIPPDKYFMGEDIKLLDKEGQGYVLTNVNGNVYAFSLAENFVPIGFASHKDIMYIISCNKNGLGEGEIGVFPSPDPNNPGKWLLQYSPLRNYSDTRPLKEKTNIFRTDLFNMNPANRVEMIVRDHFDGSANIYFADGVNQLRVANTGFNQRGELTFNLASPTYTDETFTTKVNLILGSKTSLSIHTQTVTTGGNLKYGNYIFFAKYATESFDETYFMAESNPIPVYRGVNNIGSIRGGSAADRSDKKIELLLENVDTSYKYLRLGYIRHFSDYNGIPTYEFGEIFNRYEIDPGSSSLIVSVIGTEGEVFLTEEEMMLKKDTEIIPKSINQLGNRLWGANWKKVQTHDEALRDFAGMVKIGYATTAFPDGPAYQAQSSIYMQYVDHAKYDYIGYFRGEAYPFGMIAELNDGSYSEVYPLNGVDMWNNLAPDYTDGSADKGNKNGIFRFPNALNEKTFGIDGGFGMVYPIGVKFDMEDAWMSVMAANKNNWIRFNVRAIYFVRGDRYKNLKYQGIMIGACAPFLLNSEVMGAENMTSQCSIGGNFLWAPVQQNPSSYSQYRYFQAWHQTGTTWFGLTYAETSNLFWGHRNQFGYYSWPEDFDSPQKWGPIYRGYAPAYSTDADHVGDRAYMTRYFIKPDMYGFYSPDALFNPFNDVAGLQYAWRVGKTITPRTTPTQDNPGIWLHSGDGTAIGNQTAPKWNIAHVYGNFVNQTERIATIENSAMIGEGVLVKPSDTGYYDFINAADELFSNSSNIWHWAGSSRDNIETSRQWYNRSMVMAKYIGLKLDGSDVVGATLQNDDFNLDIVNLYSVNPSVVDIRNLFPNLNAIRYNKISGPILVSDVVAGIKAGSWNQYKNITAWKGDCFLQRTYFKQMYWAGDSLRYYLEDVNWDNTSAMDGEGEGTKSIRMAHGLIMGFVTENAHNIAMRSVDGRNTFFPATDVWPFAVNAYNPENVESLKLNFGYDKALSSNVFLPFDPALPNRDLRYPTRIKYSDPTIPGSYIDSYRSFRVNNYMDFDTNFGPINRLGVVFDRLVSVHEDAIVEHYVNERQVQMSEGQSAILGFGDVLSSASRKMSNFGTQHQWSVVQADSLYGIDWKRQVIWECTLQRSDSGSLFLDARDISKEASIEKWMRDTALLITNNRSDKFNYYADDTMNGEGIVTGHDPQTGDVYFIFHKKTEDV